ncbi:MAG: SDR family NAD(P)-dependent oxidoreductase [Actinomycetales bacterium]|nr:SDR family NAD(P)-dependent oxidoreductase [Actinomycetales bacterium]
MDALLPALLGLRPRGPSRAALTARLGGRVVVVTGASRGIGAEVAGRFARVGARLVLLARDEGALEAVAAGIRRRGGEAAVLAVDLRDTAAATAAADRILAEFGAPELVVSNAGHSIHRAVLDSAERAHDVTRTAGVNYLGPVALLLRLLPAMAAAGRGQVIATSSTIVDIPAAGWSAYAGSKAAFEGWLRAAAPELARHGVALTSLHLPLVRTAMSAATPAYRDAPALRPVDAAKLVARAVVRRTRLWSPWWSRAAGAALQAFPALADGALDGWERRLARDAGAGPGAGAAPDAGSGASEAAPR